jgi:20S proteasome alpha/beta subunit
MTAIVGINYLDGVVMMADTEESIGSDSKSDCEKLRRFIFPVGKPPMKTAGTVLTGGAGDSHLMGDFRDRRTVCRR